MIDGLVRYALNNRLLVLVAVAGLALGGYLSLKQLPVDAFPDATPTLVQIYTASEGLSPVDVETLISYPIEISMYGLPQLEKVQSTSIFGLSRVDVYFEDGTDIYFARRLVLERLAEARRGIPPGLGEPQLGPITTGLGRIMQYTLEGENYSLMEKRTFQDWIVKPQLRTVPGVTGVLSIGGYEKQYQVKLDQNALLARDLSVADVREALAANNRNVGASFINRGGEEYIIRGYGWVDSGEAGLDDLRGIIVAERNGNPVYVGDIAEVGFGAAIRRGAQVANGEESAGGYVFKLIDTNTQKVLADVEAKVAEINKSLPEGLQISPFYSQGSLVEQAIGTVQGALLTGSLLVLVVLYLFMGNLRSTLIVVASLPLSVLVAFIAMNIVGLSANLMSLGGLAIAIGMVVDGSVVITENIFRHLETRSAQNVSMLRLVSEASREVARPIVFAVSIIIIVFLPLFTLQGVEGKLFSPMAYTISFALFGALIVALTLAPVMVSLLFKKGSAHGEPRLVGWIKAGYRPIRDAALQFPALVLGVTVVLFSASVLTFPSLGTEFVPTLREGTMMVRSTLPAGASLESAIEYGKRIQSVIKGFPEVTGTYSRIGRAEVGGDPEPVNVVATVITLKPLGKWKSGRDYEELQSAMAERVSAQIPGLANNFSQPIQLRTDELLSGVQAQLVASIFGEDLDKLSEVGDQVEALAKNVPGATDVRKQQQGGKRQIVVKPDRDALSRYGISVDKVMDTLSVGVGGDSVGLVFDGIRRFDIFLRLQEDQRERLDVIRQLPLQTTDGATIPLSRVADVSIYTGPKKISRSNASRRIYVQMNVRGRDMGGVVQDLRQRIAEEIDMPPGYFVEFGGQFENQERAMKRLTLVVPTTLGLIFLLLFSAFNSLRYATLIFLNVPFAITGGIFALWISGLYVSVPAAVGFIAVFGVAVLNGVVLVEYINQLRNEGMEMEEAVRTGAEHRLRPVLMTALTSILGLLPLLLANGIGANVQRPLAAVVVGGLITSTLLTLLVLPAVYKWFAEPRREVEI
ncbi:MAG: CusA/CzcA family heavy metal efflux RND transporter [Salinisphaeraceae bacterium]|uniref:CusA/CzcA family heavy metal efflux RND transporter n=2 Tax=Spectribacter TaxID=3160928 RepID=A0ABU3C2H0_9GAMM|nr:MULTISPECIES: CusA/CzcA family heavy metal efflux RND transporter [unclassified Salinisphaera]MDT0618397.1 CusA/CzcA family heavy metal efflux RND transporter [Salinisphaera sp. P385]MDT0635755.1 CusA/CzcA family heavy metal efflux RND transporter [Salinisphaera sp. W335]